MPPIVPHAANATEPRAIIAQIAGVHATAVIAYADRSPATGAGVGEVRGYAKQFLDLSERLRVAEPCQFTDLPRRSYNSSIANRMALLRQVALDSYAILVTAHNLGLCSPPPLLLLTPNRDELSGFRLRVLLPTTIAVAAGLIVAGAAFHIGWTR
jgi:hypothetical protein